MSRFQSPIAAAICARECPSSQSVPLMSIPSSSAQMTDHAVPVLRHVAVPFSRVAEVVYHIGFGQMSWFSRAQARPCDTQMIEHVLADEDLDESDVQPAPKLMEIVLQNCRGRVDAVVAPYLTLVLRRLHASRSPYMQVRSLPSRGGHALGALSYPHVRSVAWGWCTPLTCPHTMRVRLRCECMTSAYGRIVEARTSGTIAFQ